MLSFFFFFFLFLLRTAEESRAGRKNELSRLRQGQRSHHSCLNMVMKKSTDRKQHLQNTFKTTKSRKSTKTKNISGFRRKKIENIHQVRLKFAARLSVRVLPVFSRGSVGRLSSSGTPYTTGLCARCRKPSCTSWLHRESSCRGRSDAAATALLR